MANTKVLWITIWWTNLVITAGFLFRKNNDYVTFDKTKFEEKHDHEVTEWIKIDKELHVKLFFKGCSVPLPQWFRQGTDCQEKAC